MKPRLPPRRLTDEDHEIFWMWTEGVPGDKYDLTHEIWRESDRRDADLMLQAMAGIRCIWRPADNVCGWGRDLFYGWELPL